MGWFYSVDFMAYRYKCDHCGKTLIGFHHGLLNFSKWTILEARDENNFLLGQGKCYCGDCRTDAPDWNKQGALQ